MLRSTQVDEFKVAAATYFEVLDAHLQAVRSPTRCVSFALHIGGLNKRKVDGYPAAFNRADITYADGASIAILASISAKRRVERCPTTDLGVDLLALASKEPGFRPLRVAVVGGSESLLRDAVNAIESRFHVTVVFAHDGYRKMHTDAFEKLRSSNPDIVVVGLGMPLEAFFVDQHVEDLPSCLILTCGGWLGFLAGHEVRAPVWMQKCGMEWIYRLAQSPSRLAARYATGVFVFARALGKSGLTAIRQSVSR